MATAVDIITYLNTTPETSAPKQNNNADFEKVFSTVNKNYNDNNTSKDSDNKAKSTTDYNQNQSEQKISDNQKQSDKNQTEQKISDNRKEAENNQKIDDNNSKTKNEQNENNLQEKVNANNSKDTKTKPEEKLEQKTDIETVKNQEQTVQNTTEQDNLNLLEEINIQVNNQINQQTEVIAEAPVIDVIPVRAELNSQSEKLQEQPPQVQINNPTASAQVLSNIQNRDSIQTNQVNNQNSVESNTKTNTNKDSITTTTIQAEQQTTTQALVNNQLNNQTAVTENNTQTTQIPVQTVPQNQLETSPISSQEINNNYVNENSQQIITAQNNQDDLIQQATIQESTSQKGQVVDLIKASTIKELTQTQTQNIQIQDTSTTGMIIQDDSEIKEQMPVIATNLATANKVIGSQNNNDNDIKDITVKNPLTQEIIDKTNAKVVNLESSGSKSSNSDLLSKQSPQEQLVKLSLNADNKTESSNTILTNIADNNIQTTFDKTLNSIQNQAPKELSKTDILSQIHNQLDKFGQDEGTTKVTIVLKPENLGRIQLELVNSKEGLTAKMTTDNAQVKQLLDKNLDSLKDTIGTQGVNVNNVSVKLENTQNQTNDQFAYEEHQEKNNQQQSNNPQNKDQNESKFANEMNSKLDSEKESEQTANNSEISYKV